MYLYSYLSANFINWPKKQEKLFLLFSKCSLYYLKKEKINRSHEFHYQNTIQHWLQRWYFLDFMVKRFCLILRTSHPPFFIQFLHHHHNSASNDPKRPRNYWRMVTRATEMEIGWFKEYSSHTIFKDNFPKNIFSNHPAKLSNMIYEFSNVSPIGMSS